MTDTYPGWHEGVEGIERDPHLLSLADEALPTRKIVAGLIDSLWDAVLVVSPIQKNRERYERMKDPQPGDLVIETTTLWGGDRLVKGFGYLLLKRTEWYHDEKDWAEVKQDYENDPRPTDTAWYVQYGPNPKDVCRWTNCSFTAMPLGRLL